MNLQDLEVMKQLIESGDKSSLELHILKNVLTKGDMTAAAKVNPSIESEKDSMFNGYLETWKTNNLETLVQGRVEEQVKQLNPQKSPAEIEVENLRREIEQERLGRTREGLKAKALGKLSESGLTLDEKLLERLIGDDEETTVGNLELLTGLVTNAKQAALDGFYKDNGTKPPTGNVGTIPGSIPLSELASEANLRTK